MRYFVVIILLTNTLLAQNAELLSGFLSSINTDGYISGKNELSDLYYNLESLLYDYDTTNNYYRYLPGLTYIEVYQLMNNDSVEHTTHYENYFYELPLQKSRLKIESVILSIFNEGYRSYSRIRTKTNNLDFVYGMDKSRTESDYTSYINYGLRYKTNDNSLNIMVGKYRVHFGSGYLLSNSYTFNSYTYITNKYSDRLSLNNGFDRSNYLHGIAISGKILPYFTTTFFYSDKDSSTVSKSGVKSESLFGVNNRISLLKQLDISLLAAQNRTTFNIDTNNTLNMYSVGIHYNNIKAPVYLEYLNSGGKAGITTNIKLIPIRDVSLEFNLFSLQQDYYTPYLLNSGNYKRGYAFGLGIHTKGLNISAKIEQRVKMKPGIGETAPTKHYIYGLAVSHKLNKGKLSFTLSYSEKEKFKPKGAVNENRMNTGISYGNEISKQVSYLVKLNYTTHAETINEDGYSLLTRVKYLITGGLSCRFGYSIFNTASFSSAQYINEYNLPEYFRFYPAYGDGNLFFILADYNIFNRLKLSVKYRVLNSSLPNNASGREEEFNLRIGFQY